MEMSVDMMSIATDFYANIDLINWQRSYFSTWASLWKKKIEEVASAGGTKSMVAISRMLWSVYNST